MRYVFLLIFLPICCYSGANFKALDLSADSIVLMNADTGRVLYSKNGKKAQFPASTTKIATALYALHIRGDKLDSMIVAQPEAIGSISQEEMDASGYTLPPHYLVRGATHMGIKRGEELSLEVLLYGTLLASAGDATNVIAQYIGGTIAHFVKEMNAYLKEIGCCDTHFTNTHGLFHPNHTTTAYDLALMTKTALKNPIFRKIVRTVSYPRPETNKQKPSVLIQGNRLLRQGPYYYSKAIGVKTGYLAKSKSTLVAAAEDQGRTLIAVMLKVDDRKRLFQDAKILFEEAFQEEKVKMRLLKKGEQKFSSPLPQSCQRVVAYLKEDVVFEYYPSEAPKFSSSIHWETLSSEVKRGQTIGTLVIKDILSNRELSVFLYAAKDYSVSYFDRCCSWLKSWIY